MNRALKVVRQEFKMTAANKAFVIITIIGPFLILALAILPGLVSMNTKVEPGTVVAVVGGDTDFFERVRDAAAGADLILIRESNLATARKRVLSGSLQGVLVLPADYLEAKSFTYYSKTGTDLVVSKALADAVGPAVVGERLVRAGIDPAAVSALSSQPSLSIEQATRAGGTKSQDFTLAIFTAIGFIMLLYMTVLLYGQMIGRSVVAEKSSKTVEIMLSSVRPSELLFGKIVGKGLAGLLQYAIWVCVALVLIRVVGPAFHLPLPPSLTPANLFFLVLSFILAFFLYSSAYAALGAGAEDEQHLGQLAWPLVLFLVIPLTMIGALVTSPDSPVSLFFSLFPLTSPIVMLVRVLVASPPAWQLLLCVAILLAAIAGTIFLAARIFRVGILLTGKRARLSEILKWVRY